MGSLPSANLSTGIYIPLHFCVAVPEELRKVLEKYLAGQVDISSVFQKFCVKVTAASTGNLTALKCTVILTTAFKQEM